MSGEYIKWENLVSPYTKIHIIVFIFNKNEANGDESYFWFCFLSANT